MLRDNIIKIFKTAQQNKTSFQKQQEKIKKLYEKHPVEEFVEAFIEVVKQPLLIGKSSTAVDNALEFAAKICVGGLGDNCEENYILTRVVMFLVKHHSAKDKGVRYRICNFLSILLNSMGEEAIVDDELFDQISNAMLDRIQDVSAKVREQAAMALQRLQDPEMDNCPIISVFIFHMTRDPNAGVREKILGVIAKTKKTLPAAVKRIHDKNANVRKAAYKFISRVTVNSLTIAQKETILEFGLNDNSTMVVDTVKKVLLPSWLRHYNYDYIALLKGLDPENSLKISKLALKTMLEKEDRPWKKLMTQAEVDETTLLIPIEKLSSEKILLWRCVIDHVKPLLEEESENIMPDLTPFCHYIQSYIDLTKSKRFEFWEEKSQEFVLFQLLDMIEMYDRSDEHGNNCLKQMLIDILKTSHQSERIIACIVGHLKVIIPNIGERITTILDIINEIRMPMQLTQIPSQTTQRSKLTDKDRHEIKMKLAQLKVQLNEFEEDEYEAIQTKQYLAAEQFKSKIEAVREQMNKLLEETAEPEPVIQETQEELTQEKNDPETVISCLRIITSLMKSAEVREVTPVLRTLMENLALHNTVHTNKTIRKLALIFLGICCMLDEQLAKTHIFTTFLVQFSMEQECPEICEVTLKIIFDILCSFGLKTFDITYDHQEPQERTRRLYSSHDDSFTSKTVETSNARDGRKVMQFLVDLMDAENIKCRQIATFGLIKLIANDVIVSPKLLSRIIIQLHNPDLKSDPYLIHVIIAFLNYFVTTAQSQQQLKECYFMTLNMLKDEIDNPVYSEIDENKVSDLILILTRSENQKSGYSSVHNELSKEIIDHLLDDESEFNKDILLKDLSKLDVKFDSEEQKEEFIDQLDQIIQKLQKNHVKCVKLVAKLKDTLQLTQYENDSSDHRTGEPPTVDSLIERVLSNPDSGTPEEMEVED